jgi:hypothetical protein
MENIGSPNFGKFRTHQGGIPELNGVNRWHDARGRPRSRIDWPNKTPLALMIVRDNGSLDRLVIGPSCLYHGCRES